MPDDLPSAARRVAAHARYATGDMREVASEDLRILLPVLHAVARSGGDAGRVERWARAMCEADGMPPDVLSTINRTAFWKTYVVRAEATIALADAERALALSPQETSDVV